MTPSPELQAKIAIWRQKAAEGTLTFEETLEAVAALRAGRLSAAASSDRARTKKATKIIPSADDLLNEIGEM